MNSSALSRLESFNTGINFYKSHIAYTSVEVFTEVLAAGLEGKGYTGELLLLGDMGGITGVLALLGYPVPLPTRIPFYNLYNKSL